MIKKIKYQLKKPTSKAQNLLWSWFTTFSLYRGPNKYFRIICFLCGFSRKITPRGFKICTSNLAFSKNVSKAGLSGPNKHLHYLSYRQQIYGFPLQVNFFDILLWCLYTWLVHVRAKSDHVLYYIKLKLFLITKVPILDTPSKVLSGGSN